MATPVDIEAPPPLTVTSTATTDTDNNLITSTSRQSQSQATVPGKQRFRGSCDRCQEAKLKCSRDQPTCARCAHHNTKCVYSLYRRVGRPRKVQRHPQTQHGNPNNNNTTDPSQQASQLPPTPASAHRLPDTRNGSLPFDSNDWTIGTLETGFQATVDTYDWGGEEFGQLDDMGSYTNKGEAHDASSFLNPQSCRQGSSIPEFSFASILSNSALGKVADNGVLRGPTVTRTMAHESSIPRLSSGQGSGSTSTPVSMEIMMLPSMLPGGGDQNYTCQNRCIELVGRQLAVMAAQHNRGIKMDTMLAMEKAIIPIRNAVCSCTACVNNILVMLLLTMLVEQIVTLFEKLSDCSHLASNEPFDDERMADIEWSLNNNGTDIRITGGSTGGMEITSKSPLRLGRYEVDKAEKSEFLMKVLRLRLNRTASHLLKLQERLNGSSLMDCKAMAAQSIARNAHSRTEVLIGMLEMWKVPVG